VCSSDLGNAEVVICEFNGKTIAMKQTVLAKSEGSFQLREMEELPAGMYNIIMRVNNRFFANARFCKL
jgi:hypothetical protein